ncbi:hypothetical protein EUGRSUZ_A00674 [Eucalyptus grandis]|uniref:Transmembrane protein n=2 Tax=Eucalyptus grandis TaxID=71139 RepID=A0A059DD02_EUCGR|nr:hypothetical protein EUGRSUZ_A00674 [Eucalyptus grandis]
MSGAFFIRRTVPRPPLIIRSKTRFSVRLACSPSRSIFFTLFLCCSSSLPLTVRSSGPRSALYSFYSFRSAGVVWSLFFHYSFLSFSFGSLGSHLSSTCSVS